MEKQAMKRLVRCYRDTRNLAKNICELFGNAEQLDNIEGELLDAVWIMLGENTKTITESVTYRVMNSDMGHDEAAETLIRYMDRNVEQPSPVFFSEEQVKQMQTGYAYNAGALDESRKATANLKKVLAATEGIVQKLQERLKNARISLRDARNELCYKCGKYAEAHIGACDDCRWHEEWRRDLNDDG